MQNWLSQGFDSSRARQTGSREQITLCEMVSQRSVGQKRVGGPGVSPRVKNGSLFQKLTLGQRPGCNVSGPWNHPGKAILDEGNSKGRRFLTHALTHSRQRRVEHLWNTGCPKPRESEAGGPGRRWGKGAGRQNTPKAEIRRQKKKKNYEAPEMTCFVKIRCSGGEKPPEQTQGEGAGQVGGGGARTRIPSAHFQKAQPAPPSPLNGPSRTETVARG